MTEQEGKFSPLINKHHTIMSILTYDNIENAKFVGGCVRDFLLTKTISYDIDISTILTPDEVILRLKQYKKTNENNINLVILDKDKKYGTIIAILNGQKYEITTTRSDIACFGRQAEVKFCKDYKTDSLRRDFTINALYLGLDGKILDFHNGVEDLKNRRLCFIGDTKQRIEEDFLRIVRYFRFATKFDIQTFSANDIETIKALKNGLKNISRERIRSEIYKMLEYKNWFYGLNLLKNNDLIEDIFLVKMPLQIENTNITNNTANLKNNIVKLFYFFQCNITTLKLLKENLKFTREEGKFADFLIHFWQLFGNKHQLDIEAKMFIYYANKDDVSDAIKLLIPQFSVEIENFINKIVPSPVSAKDIISFGFEKKSIGVALKKIDKIFVKSDFTASKEELLNDIELPAN